MGSDMRYSVDESRVVSEIIDGEAVIVNLANGYYYSLDASAAAIWNRLQAGSSVAEIVLEIRAHHDCSKDEPEAAVHALIDTLVADDLVTPAPDREGPPPSDAPTTAGDRTPFRAPSLQRFEDMQGFLLVDPIHEVDDTGWPNVKPGESAASRG